MKNRDLTTTQYLAALHRNGFRMSKYNFLGYVETEQVPGVNFGPIVDRRTGRIMRRESVAHFIRSRDKHLAKTEAA